MKEFRELFENKITKARINKLLSELKKQNLICLNGKPQSTKSFWELLDG